MSHIEQSDRCPSCQQTISTPGEAAVHVCPTALSADPTPAEVRAAELETMIRVAERAAKQPTYENLRADVRKLAQAIIDGWDREVEFVLVLVPKGTLDNMAVARFLVGDHAERQKQILNRVLRRGSEGKKINGS